MILADFSGEAVLERLLRYEHRIERCLYRTLNQLRQVHDQCQKAAEDGVKTLERWREEGWETKKARMFARYRPADNPPRAEDTATNKPWYDVSEEQDNPSCRHASPAAAAPAENKMCKTNPIPEGVSSPKGEIPSSGYPLSGESCKTKPIADPPEADV